MFQMGWNHHGTSFPFPNQLQQIYGRRTVDDFLQPTGRKWHPDKQPRGSEEVVHLGRFSRAAKRAIEIETMI